MNMFQIGIETIYTNMLQQAFTNCVHGYDRARNVHANNVTHTQKFVHVIDSV